MKRIAIAAVLLIITVALNVLSERMVYGYCDEIKEDLNSIVESIDKKDYKMAKKLVNVARANKSLVPFIYNLDFKKIKKELDDAENLIDMKEDEYAKICVLRSISLADDIFDEYAFFHNKKAK